MSELPAVIDRNMIAATRRASSRARRSRKAAVTALAMVSPVRRVKRRAKASASSVLMLSATLSSFQDAHFLGATSG